jgi:serine/threonine protein kinase
MHILDYEENAGSYNHRIFVLMSPVGDNDLKAFLHNAIHHISEATESGYRYAMYLRTWIQCLASALAYLHAQQIQHEDIKPSNIIHYGSHVLFTDFGSSRDVKLRDTTATASPALATRLFAAPEAMVDRDGNVGRHGSKSDVFSLGLVFAEMLWVLSGGKIPLREHIRPQSGRSTPFSQYHEVVVDIDLLLMNSNTAFIYRECVKPMLNLERQERPTAGEVVGSIDSLSRFPGGSLHTLNFLCQEG